MPPSAPGRVLAGDVGGTNSRLAIYEVGSGGTVRPAVSQTLPSIESDSFDDLFAGWVAEHCPRDTDRAVDAVCLGVAGPIRDGEAKITNRPWVVRSSHLAETTGTPRVELINDLEATAWGLGALGSGDLRVLHPAGSGLGPTHHADPSDRSSRSSLPGPGHAALLAPGTGLGQARLFWDGRAHLPLASEGGHATFAPHGARQRALAAHLEQVVNRLPEEKRGKCSTEDCRVSWERVLSGPGIADLYRFVLEERGESEASQELALRGDDSDPPRITAAGLAGDCPVAVSTLELFVDCLGALAGDLALLLMARGGVFLAGGIPAKLVPVLTEGPLRERLVGAYLDKGRMRSVVEAIPLVLVTDERVGLAGAARRAAELAASAVTR